MRKAGCISGPRSSNRLRAILSKSFAVAPLFCLSAACFGQSAGKVTAVRFWTTADSTRIAIEVSGEFKFKSDRLANPPRLFFDVQDSRPAVAQKTIPIGDKLVKQIRIAETQRGVTRIVLDLEQDADFAASQLSSPERLIVEVRPKGSQTPQASETESAAPKKFDPPAQPPPETAAQLKPLPAPPVLTAVNRAAGVPASAVRKLPAPPEPAPAPSRKLDLPEPKAAARNANGERSLTRVLGLKLGRVVLDPGHGGHDVGTHGPSGLYEKDLVLDISQRLAALLQDRLGSEVLLTRTDDTFIPLEERTRIANDYK